MVSQDERQKNIKPFAKNENVVFQASDNVQSTVNYNQNQGNYNSYSYGGPLDNSAYAMHNHYRPRAPRPLCTHCGLSGHVIQKCYKLHGYPPGYIPGYKSNPASPGYQASTRPTFGQSFQSRAQFSSRRPPLHVVANVMTSPFTSPSVYSTPETVSTSLTPQNSTVTATPLIPHSSPVTPTVNNMDLKQMNNEQIQSLLQ
ncbi:unnamed protein product [Arabidopsis halleri]